ncbi:cation:proton antiporter [Nocardioides insulae]|uniref:cation:proton antiporter n=1 Tax=Nocardioides insulae TaxID=394734 RepID=UPI000423C464|nr:sodium:proton antiporter [Nocardioides insulae]
MEPHFVTVAGAGLAIMIAAAVFARRTGVAAPLLLVTLGILASLVPGAPTIEVDPELILAGVLPPLLYSSAVELPVIDLRRNFGLIAWLSVAMVIISALVIGVAVHWVFPDIPLGLAIALGAVVSPTDAVAATAVGRRLGLPPRLMTVLEGESLLNDASALVLLRTAVAGLAAAGSFSLGRTVLEFAWAVVGAVVVGALIGWITALLRRQLDDPVLNTTISFAIPFLAYFPAEEVNASGVLAVVVAGLATGSLGARWFSPRDRETQATTWTTVNFVLESALFLAMGYQLTEVVDAANAESDWGTIARVVGLVLALLVGLRFLGLAWPALSERFGRGGRGEHVRARLDRFEEHLENLEPTGKREENRVSWARHRLARGRADLDFEDREPITARGYFVVAWAGMRGAVTVAAAQTIPAGTPHRSTVVLIAFLVALVTLVFFGLTLPLVIARMNLRAQSKQEQRNAVLALTRQVGEAAIESVGPVEEQTVDGEPLDDAVLTAIRDGFLPRMLGVAREQNRPRRHDLEKLMIVQRRYLEAMRSALWVERSIGAYSSGTYRHVEATLDALDQRLDSK